MRIAALFTYPIKSCYRVPAGSAVVERWGLAGDRRWLIVDAQGLGQLTQREVPALGRIRPVVTDGGLLLRADGHAELHVPAPRGVPLVDVGVWRDPVAASPAGTGPDGWVSAVIGRAARLVYLDDPTRRQVNPKYGVSGDVVSFADGYPLLLTNAASLTALNDWLLEDGEEPIEMTRFRPNLVVEGASAWAEDDWLGRRIKAGTVAFRAVKPCARCVLTTIDPETGQKGGQPLRILGRYRRFPQGLLFGINLIPDGTGIIDVSDEVSLA